MEKLFSFFKKTFLKKRILFHIFKRIIFFSSCDFVLKINHNCYNGNFYSLHCHSKIFSYKKYSIFDKIFFLSVSIFHLYQYITNLVGFLLQHNYNNVSSIPGIDIILLKHLGYSKWMRCTLLNCNKLYYFINMNQLFNDVLVSTITRIILWHNNENIFLLVCSVGFELFAKLLYCQFGDPQGWSFFSLRKLKLLKASLIN